MKKLIGVWLFVLLAGPAFAQTSLIGDIAAERAKYPDFHTWVFSASTMPENCDPNHWPGLILSSLT